MRKFTLSVLFCAAAATSVTATTPEQALVNQNVVGAEVQLPITNSDTETTFGVNGVFPIIKATEVTGFSVGPSVAITAIDAAKYTSIGLNPGVTITKGFSATSVGYVNLGYEVSAGKGDSRGVNGAVGYRFQPSPDSVVIGFGLSYFPEQEEASAVASVGFSF